MKTNLSPLTRGERNAGKQSRLFQRIAVNYDLYLFLLPAVLLFFCFHYIPIYGVQIAFKNFSPARGIWGSPWTGFNQFLRFFRSFKFSTVIGNTLYLSVYNLLIGFPFPIFLALIINSIKNKGYKRLFQTVTYMPYFISTVVVVGMMMQLLNPRIGVINNLIELLGGTRKDFMADPNIFASVYVWSNIWQYFGWNSIIYLAVLSGIPPELHESAMIDGAGRFKRILYVDLPGIVPTMIVLLIMNFGQVMSVGFEKIYLMQNSLNLSASQVISTYVYQVGLRGMPPEFSYGSAIDMFNSVINLVMIVLVNSIARKFSETSLW